MVDTVEISPPGYHDDPLSGQTTDGHQAREPYQLPLKRCKGPCGQDYPGTPESFQRCKKYKLDGLETWCKTCSKERRKKRSARSGLYVVHPPRHFLDARGYARCLRCGGQIYHDELDGDLRCLMCNELINPPPMPASVVYKLAQREARA